MQAPHQLAPTYCWSAKVRTARGHQRTLHPRSNVLLLLSCSSCPARLPLVILPSSFCFCCPGLLVPACSSQPPLQPAPSCPAHVILPLLDNWRWHFVRGVRLLQLGDTSRRGRHAADGEYVEAALEDWESSSEKNSRTLAYGISTKQSRVQGRRRCRRDQ
jgi:hypothetical protein